MNSASRTISIALVLSCACAWGQAGKKPGERDLTFEKDSKKAAAPPVTESKKTVTIPRSYALVIGIGAYKNLPKEAQLEFPERDAQSMYSALISPEGGNFKAENVHVL